MTYITKAQARSEEDTITAANGVSDDALETFIEAVGIWINNNLDADTEVDQTYGETVYIDFQYSDSSADSYCLEAQYNNIVRIVTLEVCARALAFKKKTGSTAKVVHLDPKRPVWASESYEEVRKSKDYHARALALFNSLIEEDKKYGHFIHTRDQAAGEGFVKVNRKKGPVGQWTVKQLMELID